MPNKNLLNSEDQVLSTLNQDGSRRWLRPRLSKGRFWWHRRIVAYFLIVLFVTLPWLKVNGMPAVLLDLPTRQFTIFGTTFLPTDTLLLMLLVASVFVTVFLITALFGRIWCGWACPQTVYLEFVFRPLERLIEGKKKRRGDGDAGVGQSIRLVIKYVVYLLISLGLAHVFLSYFVPVEELFTWMQRSPLEHPTGFLIVMFVTGMMMFDFSFFREQTCIVACPYGRFQSVMLDRHSMIVTYDEQRGEPRGKKKRAKSEGDVALAQLGDCVDCKMCVTTCPTGIDIRKGLQMECIGCAQCIDACNSVMKQVGRDPGLIRYSSQSALEGASKSLIRPRLFVYPLLLGVFATLFVLTLAGRGSADVTVIRSGDRPYVQLDGDLVSNPVVIKIVNRTDEVRGYQIDVQALEGARVELDQQSLTVPPLQTLQVNASFIVPRSAFKLGKARLTIVVTDDEGNQVEHGYRLQGPFGGGTVSPADDESSEGKDVS